jgi:hypothetical protein
VALIPKPSGRDGLGNFMFRRVTRQNIVAVKPKNIVPKTPIHDTRCEENTRSLGHSSEGSQRIPPIVICR